MKIKDLKKLEHVTVAVNANGMAKVTVDDGYCLQSTEMQEVAADPMQPLEGGAEPEKVAVHAYAREIYCRKDSVLPDYVVVGDEVLNTEEPTEE